MNTFGYVGKELDTFACARNWKRYWSSQLGRFIAGDVLEVGAGIGANTKMLRTSAGRVCSWTSLDPDPYLAGRLREKLSADPATAECHTYAGTTQKFDLVPQFDTLLYIDVLEHIEQDREEMRRAAGLLRRGGHIVVLAPAHQWLYSRFDEAIGHFRRYNKATLKACGPADCELVVLRYVDSAGMLASIGNRLLQQRQPSLRQIFFWDRWLVPASIFVDRLVFRSIGKSIIGIWRKR